MQANQIFRVLIQLRLLRRQTLDRRMSPKPIRFANLMLCCLLLSIVKNQRFARTFTLQFPMKFHDIMVVIDLAEQFYAHIRQAIIQ